LGRLSWLPGELVEIVPENERARTLRIRVPGWTPHRAGQHVDLRLTADDGYEAVRSYSLAAPAQNETVSVTVERLDDGEVSPYLVDEMQVGDQLELRGPVGGYFVWDPGDPTPLSLIAGGSGVVPIVAMIRQRALESARAPMRLLYSARSEGDLLFCRELDDAEQGVAVFYTLTRSQPQGWTGYRRRVDREMLEEVAWPVEGNPQAFVCGPTAFVEHVAELLLEIGYPPAAVRTERFGPTGGRDG
jgi:ferredoxin-NADP reductase